MKSSVRGYTEDAKVLTETDHPIPGVVNPRGDGEDAKEDSGKDSWGDTGYVASTLGHRRATRSRGSARGSKLQRLEHATHMGRR